jgi:phosphosulfolactate synthase (CoM biosynthesis protein A)
MVRFYDNVRAVSEQAQCMHEEVHFDAQCYGKAIDAQLTTEEPEQLLKSVSSVGCDVIEQGTLAQSIAVHCRCEDHQHVRGLLRHPKVGHRKGQSSAMQLLVPMQQINMRFVPDQRAEDIIECVRQHVHSVFAARGSRNKVSVVPRNQGSYWLSDPDDWLCKSAKQAVKKVGSCLR